MPSRTDTDALLEQLFELPPAQWPQRLDVLCREYPQHAERLRRRHDLLAATGLDAPAAPPPPIGVLERFGDYRIVRRLGAGGMGMVFVAEQCSLGRPVAIKFVRPELTFSPFARERFRREIDAIAQLDHPGIVPILAHDQTGDTPYYVMPLVNGASGDDVIQRLQGTDPRDLTGRDLRRALIGPDGSDPGSDPAGVFEGAWWQACVRLVRQAALALHHAHRHGIVHRDVKPSNLLFTADGRALVVDFGLARSGDDARITRSGAAPGSPAYMPPEQLRGGAIDARADVYSLAISLHHLLALRHPLPIDDSDALRTAILNGRREALPAGGVPPELEIVLGAAMDLEPQRRHATADAFAADLLAVLEQRPIVARALPRRLRVRRWMQRHPTTTTAVALVALLLTATPTLVAFGVAGERDRALAAEAGASRNAYEANIAAANAALRAGDRIEAERRLDACPQGLRGFEWRHLHQALSGSLRELAGHTTNVTAVAIRDDASWMVSADDAGGVRVSRPLQADANGPLLALPDRRPIEAVAIAADGSRVTVVQTVTSTPYVAHVGPTIRVLDTATAAVLAERASTSLGERVCFAADGDSLLVIDGLAVQQLDAFTLSPLRDVQLTEVAGTVVGPVAFDGDWLFATAQRTLCAWRIEDGRGSVLHDAILGGAKAAAASVRRGSAVFTSEGRLTVVDVEPLRVSTLDGGERTYDGVAMDASGEFVAAVGADQAFRAWSTATGRATCQAFGRPEIGRAVAIASRRLLAVVGGAGGGVVMHGMFGTNERQSLIGHSGVVGTLTPLRDGMLLSSSHEPAVRVWNPVSGAPIAASYDVHYWVRGVAMAPGGDHAFVAYAEHVLSLHLPDLAVLAGLQVDEAIRHVFACDDSRAVAVLTDRLVEMDVAAGRRLTTAPVESGRVRAASTAGSAGVLVATPTAIERWRLTPHLERVATLPVPQTTAITCSRDGETMFTSEGQWLRRRRVEDGALVWERPCAQTVKSLLLLADESRLVTGHDDGSVSLWRPADCVCVATFRAGPCRVCALAADPAGSWLAAADEQATVTLLRGGTDDESFAARLARADTMAAMWLDNRLRGELATTPAVAAAIDACRHLDAALRDAMARADRLRPFITWEGLAERLDVTLRSGQPAREYERALRVAEAYLVEYPRAPFGELVAAFGNVRLHRDDEALRHAELCLQAAPNGGEAACASAARAIALWGLDRRDEARAELERLEAAIAGLPRQMDLEALAAEVRRLVTR